MKIAYRRMSGAIGLSDKEIGTRGLWWEKRRSLVRHLIERGHTVDYCSRMTKHSSNFPVTSDLQKHDILLVEFGSENKRFYGKDLEETIRICNEFSGPKVFLSDDPDLTFLWSELSSFKSWSCWYNAVRKPSLGKQPLAVPTYDFSFSAISPHVESACDYQLDYLAYIGRPSGRKEMVRYLIANKAPWRVFGKQEEWADYGIFVSPPPNQPQRAQFYASQLGCLTIADKKHKQMGWRTGRAYHSILAGCPTLLERDHQYLTGFLKFGSVDDINKYLHRWRDPELRKKDCAVELSHCWSERYICDKTLEAHGL